MPNRYAPIPFVRSLEAKDLDSLQRWWEEQARQLEFFEESIQNLASNPYFIQKYTSGGSGRLLRNAGTVAVTAGTCVSISHALKSTPNQVFVTPNANVGNFWVTALTSISFAVQWQTSVSVSTNIFWQAEL